MIVFVIGALIFMAVLVWLVVNDEDDGDWGL